jgi:hypothetical protein
MKPLFIIGMVVPMSSRWPRCRSPHPRTTMILLKEIAPVDGAPVPSQIDDRSDFREIFCKIEREAMASCWRICPSSPPDRMTDNRSAPFCRLDGGLGQEFGESVTQDRTAELPSRATRHRPPERWRSLSTHSIRRSPCITGSSTATGRSSGLSGLRSKLERRRSWGRSWRNRQRMWCARRVSNS